jgi:coatomer protein complex subunit gamma
LDIVAPSPIAQEASQPTAANIQSLYTAQLQSVPELEPYGPVLRSSTKPVALTESETEYVVTAVKHIFKEHIVFQVSPPLPVRVI